MRTLSIRRIVLVSLVLVPVLLVSCNQGEETSVYSSRDAVLSPRAADSQCQDYCTNTYVECQAEVQAQFEACMDIANGVDEAEAQCWDRRATGLNACANSYTNCQDQCAGGFDPGDDELPGDDVDIPLIPQPDDDVPRVKK